MSKPFPEAVIEAAERWPKGTPVNHWFFAGDNRTAHLYGDRPIDEKHWLEHG